MKRAGAVCGTAVLATAAAVCVHLWSTSPEAGPGTSEQRSSTRRPARAPRNGSLLDGAVAGATGTETIRGRVVGPGGPVAGAVVAAFKPYDAEDDPLARALCVGSAQVSPVGDCEGGDEASAAVAESFAARQLERPALARATTDAEGRFSLEGLAAGSYDVWAERQGGFATSAVPEVPAEDVELTLEAGLLVEGKVEVNGAAPAEALLVSGAAAGFPRIFEAQTGDGGQFTLGPLPATTYAALSTSLDGHLGAHEVISLLGDQPEARVTLQLVLPRRLAGVVLEDGRPAAGVTVALEGGDLARDDVVTGVDGRFAFENLHPWEYSVRATGSFAVASETVWVSGGRDPRPVTLELQPVGRVRGVVRDEIGRPVAKAAVFLSGHETVETGDDGRFELREASSTERLVVRAEGFLLGEEEVTVAPGETVERDVKLVRALVLKGTVVDEAGKPLPMAGITIRDGSAGDGTQTVSRKDGEFELETDRPTAEVDVELQEYVTVHHTLSAASPARIVLAKGGSLVVRLVDSDGKPVTDGSVLASPLRGGADRRSLMGRRSGPGNEFNLTGMTAGDYRVEVRTDAATEIRIARSDGRGRQALEVKLPALGQISGTVVGPDGAPVPQVYVRAYEVEGEGRRRFSSSSSTNTDEQGKFEIPARRGIRYELAAYKDNRMPVNSAAVVPDGAPVKIVLGGSAKVRGRILYPDGAPASLFILNTEYTKSPDGRFQQEVSPGELHLSFAAPGYAPRVKSLTLQDGQDVDLGDLTLAEGRAVEVRVVDARTGAPVRGATVHVSGLDVTGNADEAAPVDEPSRRTRSNGVAALQHVPERAVVTVEAEGYQSATVQLGTGSSEVVRLEPNGTLRVVLDDPFQGPLWAMVEGPVDRILPMDPVAGAAFPSLPAGDYVVVLWSVPPPPGKSHMGTLAPVQPQEISFPSEGSTGGEVHFRLRASGADVTVRVAGVAVDWEEQVMLVKPGVDVREVTSDVFRLPLEKVILPERPGNKGPARFPHLVEGAYRVAVRLSGPVGQGLYVAPEPLAVHGAEPREVVVALPDDWRPLPE